MKYFGGQKKPFEYVNLYYSMFFKRPKQWINTEPSSSSSSKDTPSPSTFTSPHQQLFQPPPHPSRLKISDETFNPIETRQWTLCICYWLMSPSITAKEPGPNNRQPRWVPPLNKTLLPSWLQCIRTNVQSDGSEATDVGLGEDGKNRGSRLSLLNTPRKQCDVSKTQQVDFICFHS